MKIAKPTGSEQAALWNGRSGNAWVDSQDLLNGMYKPFEGLLIEGIAPEAEIRVLDVGCGAGATTRAVARILGPHGRCVGVDISEPMIAAAQSRGGSEGERAEFICADAEVYEFEPASFDLIVSRFGVMFFNDPVHAFTNLRRAARGNGAMRVVAWRSAAENPFMTTAERAAVALLPNLPPRRPNAPGQFAFADPTRVHAVLSDSGWAEIDIRPVDVACTFPEKELIQYFTRLGPVGQVLHEVDDKTRAQVIDRVRAAFDPYVHGADIRFTAACWMISARAPQE